MTFRKAMLFSVLTVLIGVGVVYALNYEFRSRNLIEALPTAQGVNDGFGLQITMTLEKTEYSLGEPINITLTITNIGNQTISYAYGWSGRRFDFRVYNDTNNGIYQWSDSWWFAAALDYITLNPGESLTVGHVAGSAYYPTLQYAWRQTCNNRTIVPNFVGEGIAISPGAYYIIGQTGPIVEVNGKTMDEYAPDRRFSALVIETAPIMVTIVKQ